MSLAQAPSGPSQFFTCAFFPVVDQAGSPALKLKNDAAAATNTAAAINHTIRRRSSASRADAGVLARDGRTRRLPRGRTIKAFICSNMHQFYLPRLCQRVPKNKKAPCLHRAPLSAKRETAQYLTLSDDFCDAKYAARFSISFFDNAAAKPFMMALLRSPDL